MIFAPVTISKDSMPLPNDKIKAHRKFLINMGWIPKASKNMIPTTVQYDTLG